MNELEKMLAGALYDAQVPELRAMRARARTLVARYNESTEADAQERTELMRALLGSAGDSPFIEAPFRCDYGFNIHVGHRFYANFGLIVLDCNRVDVGDDVLLGPNVQLLTATHPLEGRERARGLEAAKPVRVGHRVWIAAGAIVCPGVTIGDDTTIGAGSVVTRDVPAGVLAVGNPCRVVREVSRGD